MDPQSRSGRYDEETEVCPWQELNPGPQRAWSRAITQYSSEHAQDRIPECHAPFQGGGGGLTRCSCSSGNSVTHRLGLRFHFL